MKKYIFFFLLLFLITSCKSSKPLVSTSSETKTEEQIQKDIVSSTDETETEQSTKNETKTVDEEEITIIFRTDYDTDKPVDPTTGKHPIKSETATGRIRNSKQESRIQDQKDRNKILESSVHDSTRINTNQDKKVGSTEESPKDLFRYRCVFYCFCIFILVGLIFYLKKILS